MSNVLEGMVLKINDRIKIRTVQFFNNFSLDLIYDSIASTFKFSFYFDPENHDQEELSCVSHFHEAQLFYNGELLITGYILSQAYVSDVQRELVNISGYAKAGVLEDCQIPPSLYPLQSDGLSLIQIAQKFTKPFDLSIYVDGSVSAKMNLAYEKTTANESQSIKDYLTELAIQRDIILTHDSGGDLLFTKAKTNLKPIIAFDQSNFMGATQMQLSFAGQGLHSEITVIKQADSKGGEAGQYTIYNPFVPIVYRPKVIVQSSGDVNSLQETAQQALAAEIKSIVLTITTDRWVINGKILKPNNLISVVNPEIYLYKKTNWFIESISFEGDSEKTIATIKCVLPCVYDGSVPVNVFVDAHKNSPTPYGLNG